MSSSMEAVMKSGTSTQDIHLKETPQFKTKVNGWYARYVLFVLLLVYVVNFIDRQILAILAEDIKVDMGVTDAQLGFLYGTAFAVFYATFGIAFGRLADAWNRRKLISIGLGFWSCMTTLSGFARGFGPLAVCRFGVGVGEASASPAAYSILYDYFSPKVRTTVLAIYSGGIYIGAGLGLFIGGAILGSWNEAWPDYTMAPFGLKGWQAAFIIVGLPGVILSLWVATLKEPCRGAGDGIPSEEHPHPFREAGIVLLSMVPLANLLALSKGVNGAKAMRTNILGGLAIFLSAWGLAESTGDVLQWAALGVGIYAAFSWTQGLSQRDPVVFGLLFGCKTMVRMLICGGIMSFMGTSAGFWSVPYLQRAFGASPAEVGAVLGIAAAGMGFLGNVSGGVIADKLRQYTPKGKILVWIGGMILAVVAGLIFLHLDNLLFVYAITFFSNAAIASAQSPWISTVNDLMIPRGRATATAFAFVLTTFLGFAFGPYFVGFVSDIIASTGVDSGESLRQAMLWGTFLPVMAIITMIFTLKHVAGDEASLLDRARALGEKI